MMLKNKTLLSFKEVFPNSKLKNFYADLKGREIELSFSDATKNIMVFGGIGSGKTTSVCMPFIQKMVDNKCGGIVFDIKGGYSKYCKDINRKQKRQPCMILGADHDCEKYNLLANFNRELLEEYLHYQQKSERVGNDSYWGSEGVIDFLLIYDILIELKGKSTTFADMYYFLSNSNEIQNLILELEHRKLENTLEKIYKRRQQYIFSLFNNESGERIEEQRSWQLHFILKVLKPFYFNASIRSKFCASGEIDLETIIYKNNKIIVLDLPEAKYGLVATSITKQLQVLFRNTVKKLGESYLQSQGYGTEKFTFVLIDEYQQFITTGVEGSCDDNNWLDTSRGYGNINLLCTQSVDSLYSKSNHDAANQLIGNCRNIIHLGTNAIHSLDHIEKLSNKDVKDLLLKKSEHGLFYIGQTGKKRTGKIGIIITGQSKDHVMNKFINTNPIISEVIYSGEDEQYKPNIEYTHSYSNAYIKLSDSVYSEFYDTSQVKYNKLDHDLVVITTRGFSQGTADFFSVLNKKSLAFNNVHINNSMCFEKEWLLNVIDVIKDDCKNKTIFVFVRGGGDKLSLLPFNDNVFVEQLKLKLQAPEFLTGIGVGHADDHFLIDDHVSFHGITPTDLAYNIVDFFDKQNADLLTNLSEQYPESNSVEEMDYNELLRIIGDLEAVAKGEETFPE